MLPVYVASNSNYSGSNSVAVTTPTGTVDGDFMLALQGCNTSDPALIDTPVGWTRIIDYSPGSSIALAFFSRIFNGGASFSFSSSGGSLNVAAISTYRAVSGNPIGAIGTGNYTSGASLTVNGLTATYGNSLLIAGIATSVFATTLGAPTSMTSRVTKLNVSVCCGMYDQAAPIGGGSVSNKTATVSSGSYTCGRMFELRCGGVGAELAMSLL